MVLRSITSCPALPVEIDQPLAEILRWSQEAVRARTRLRRETVWWNVAEGWTAMELGRREIGRNVPGGPRVLVAVAVAARLTERGSELWPEAVEFGDALFEGGTDLVVAGAEAARRALAEPERPDDDLADAWIAACGVALLRVLAHARAGSAGLGGPAAAVRIAQRTVVGRIELRRPLNESRLARLACVDRRTVASWRRYRGPSPDNAGFLMTAPECAEFAGMTAKAWRELAGCGRAPAPSAQRRTTPLWDEAEVLRWIDEHAGVDVPAAGARAQTIVSTGAT